ncbi:MAG: M48 family metalloprotease [Candidatus Eremiobacteraeota bacterium]|nr:M48 family metalloprotease [Candidatus Eremiobacteraeota bacterium]
MKQFLAAVTAAAMALGCIAPAFADQQQEAQIGAQVYQQLSQKGEIIRSSPYYSILNPIAARIKRVADPQYSFPFHFILVHEAQPNAFAVPGGNVYVTDSMMRFVQNKEELSGVLCHETSHDIHHDVINNMQKDQNIGIAATVLSVLIGGGNNGIANTVLNLGANLEALHFSRAVEHSADQKGAFTCAQAGLNPWGMVWLFNHFEAHPTATPPEALSDHPRDDHRISDLENLFHGNPSTFGRFNPNISTATPLNAVGFRTDSRHTTRRQASAWKFGPR